MKMGFFPKLAFDGMRKNKKLYLPYLLTCTGMVMMYYIICYLAFSGLLSNLPGSATLEGMMTLGSGVISIFTVLFLMYSNAFLVRRRQKEFGLYNILGMGKAAISLVLFWETLIAAFSSLTVGLLAGMLFSKAAEALMVNMLHGTVTYTLTVSPKAISQTLILFAVVFLFIFLRSLWLLRKTSAINLLRSENVGEKPPKANWLFGLGGVLLLAAAYYIAVSIADPVAALMVFFAAVGMVILATYMIFISGSVLLCRILQKNKRYYYKPNHFVSVSSMAYRMNRTGAGLASVCILLTMVLVMISSTSCLYFGEESALNSRYPRQINLNLFYEEPQMATPESQQDIREAVAQVLAEKGLAAENTLDYRCCSISGLLEGTSVEANTQNAIISSLDQMGQIKYFCFVPLEDYNRLTGENETLATGEVLMYTMREPYPHDTISFNAAGSYRIKRHLDSFDVSGVSAMDVVESIYLVVPDLDESMEPFLGLTYNNGGLMLDTRWVYGFDPLTDEDGILELYEQLRHELKVSGLRIECRENERDDFYGTFGGFFFLGILLSIVFLFAAVLIIYYKQLSEGYEDQSRFEIMQKVGMTKQDIRKNINSQMLVVFFLPLMLSGLHMVFAFPIVQKLLLMFNMSNVNLFGITTLISFAVFGLFYVIVYKLTSNAYYGIVSGAKEGHA